MRAVDTMGRKNQPGRTNGRISDLGSHPRPYVTIRELADYWPVMNRSGIYKQIDAGTLPAIRLGPRSWRISTNDAFKFERVARITVQAGPKR